MLLVLVVLFATSLIPSPFSSSQRSRPLLFAGCWFVVAVSVSSCFVLGRVVSFVCFVCCVCFVFKSWFSWFWAVGRVGGLVGTRIRS